MSRGTLGAALLLGWAAAVAPVLAATYIVPTDEALIGKADAIVRGRVTGVVTVAEPGGGLHSEISVAVTRTLKGTVGPRIVIEHPGGQLADRRDVYPGTGQFREGEDVVLMLSSLPTGQYRVTDFALGKFHVGRSERGVDFLRRDGLTEAFVLENRSAEVLAAPLGLDPDRKLDAFLDYVSRLLRGLQARPDYALPELQIERQDTSTAESGNDRTAGFEFLGNPPARWTNFDLGDTVTYTDSSDGDPGSVCQPDGCHAQVAEGVVHWNSEAPGANIRLAYGGTDANIVSKCLNQLTNQINFNDPCGNIANLSGCSGTLALGGFSASTQSAGQRTCTGKGTLDYDRITAGRIMINNGVGSCLNRCDYEEMIAHETGHTIGSGHSCDNCSNLMAAQLNSGQCGILRADDIAFAQCSYGSGACTPPVVISVQTVLRDGILRAKVTGTGFHKGDIVQIDAGLGFANAPLTRFKTRQRVVGKDVASIWPAGPTVQIRVLSATGCPSNAISATR